VPRVTDLGPERRLRETDRQLAQEVPAVPLKKLVRVYVDLGIQVAARAAGLARIALPRVADALAVLDAGGNLDLDGAMPVDKPVPAALLARVAHPRAGSAAMRAVGNDPEEPAALLHASLAGAGRAPLSLAGG
jgi:hypothetical protein